MPEEAIKKLAEKLAEACDKVGGIAKKGKNTQQNYNYVKAADVAKAIRHELFERGIVVIPDEVSCEFVEFSTKTGTVMKECRLKTAYHITDGSETIIVHGYGVAMDAGDKAIYKAKTGALKYFLRGLGLIPDEKDDPEADESVDKVLGAETNEEYDQRTQDQKVVAAHQANALHEAMKRTGKSEALVSGYLKEKGYKQFEQVLRSDFQTVLKWLNTAQKASGADLTPDLEKSVREATNKKLWALAAEKSIPEGDIKTYAYEKFKVESMTRLGPEQLKDVVEWVKLL